MCVDESKFLVVNKMEAEISSVVDQNGKEIKNSKNSFEALNIKEAKLKFLPNFKSKFSNLRAIRVYQCGLTHLFSNDMRQFGAKLEIANFIYNDITYLDADLFKFNTNLKIIKLYGNPITFIDSDFSKNIKTKKSLQFVTLGMNDVNTCIDQTFNTTYDGKIANYKWNDGKCIVNRLDIDQLKLLLKIRRDNSIRTVENLESRILENMLIVQVDGLKKQALHFYEKVDQLKSKISSQGSELEKVKTQNNDKMNKLKSELSTQTNELAKLKAQNSELKQEIITTGSKFTEALKQVEKRFEDRNNALKNQLQLEFSNLIKKVDINSQQKEERLAQRIDSLGAQNNKKIDILKSEMSLQIIELAKMKTQNAELEKKIYTTGSNFTKASNLMEKLFASLINSMQSKSQSEISNLNKKIESQDLDQKRMKDEIMMEMLKIEGISQKVGERLGKRIDDNESQNKQSSLEMSANLSSLKKQVSELKKQVEDMEQ